MTEDQIQAKLKELQAQKDALTDLSSPEARRIRKEMRELRRSGEGGLEPAPRAQKAIKEKKPRRAKGHHDAPIIPAGPMLTEEEFFAALDELGLSRHTEIGEQYYAWNLFLVREQRVTAQELVDRYVAHFHTQPTWYMRFDFGSHGLIGLGPVTQKNYNPQ